MCPGTRYGYKKAMTTELLNVAMKTDNNNSNNNDKKVSLPFFWL